MREGLDPQELFGGEEQEAPKNEPIGEEDLARIAREDKKQRLKKLSEQPPVVEDQKLPAEKPTQQPAAAEKERAVPSAPDKQLAALAGLKTETDALAKRREKLNPANPADAKRAEQIAKEEQGLANKRESFLRQALSEALKGDTEIGAALVKLGIDLAGKEAKPGKKKYSYQDAENRIVDAIVLQKKGLLKTLLSGPAAPTALQDILKVSPETVKKMIAAVRSAENISEDKPIKGVLVSSPEFDAFRAKKAAEKAAAEKKQAEEKKSKPWYKRMFGA